MIWYEQINRVLMVTMLVEVGKVGVFALHCVSKNASPYCDDNVVKS